MSERDNVIRVPVRDQRDGNDLEMLRETVLIAFKRIADLTGRVAELERHVGERGAA